MGFIEGVTGRKLEPMRGVSLVMADGARGATFSEVPIAWRGSCCVVVHCRTGRCDVVFQGMRLCLSQGEACLLVNHADAAAKGLASPSGDFTGCALLVEPASLGADELKGLRDFDVNLEAIEQSFLTGAVMRLVPVGGELEHAFAQLYAMPRDAGRGQVRLRAIDLLRSLAQQLSSQRIGSRSARHLSHDQIARRAQEVMTRDLSHPLTIQATAQLCGTSPTVLKQSFRETFGVSVHEWYRACRIRQASTLLATTSYSVAQISSEVGYCNPSKFSKVFCEYMGVTPSVWRVRHRADRERLE